MTRQQRKAQDERRQQVLLALSDEFSRFNRAIESGKIVKLTTFSGQYTVKYVDSQFWYHTDGNGGFGQSWAGCNNFVWADLLAQAGIDRNPLFLQE